MISETLTEVGIRMLEDASTGSGLVFLSASAGVIVGLSIASVRADNKELFGSGLCLFVGLVLTLIRSLMKPYLLNVNPLMAAGVEWAIYLATLLFFVLSIVIYATCFFGDAFESSRSVGREKGSEQ